MNNRRLWPILIVILGSFLSGCGQSAAHDSHEMIMVPLEQMPTEVQQASLDVQKAYQYAAGNPEIFKQIPCYCGCYALHHTSNYDCYVASVAADGTITYDQHAVNCVICANITQDAVRLLKQGQTVSEVHNFIDASYAKYGTSTGP